MIRTTVWVLVLAAVWSGCCTHDSSADSGPVCPPPPKEERPTRILILGDRTGHPNDEQFRAVLKDAKRLGPDLVVGVGDVIQGYQPDTEISKAHAEWQSALSIFRNTMGKIPFYSTAGNHDVWSDSSEALFEKVMGHPPNFAFDVGRVRIILFDTSRVTTESEISDDQLNWLVSALNDAKHYAARIVVTHRPLWAIRPGGQYGSPLHDVLIAGNATHVLTGHWHHAMSDKRDGVRYYMIGPSGAKPNRESHPETGNFQQFGWLLVDKGEVTLSLLNETGVHKGDAFPYAVNQMEYKIERRAIQFSGFEIDPVRPSTSGLFQLDITNITDQPLTEPLTFIQSDWRCIPNTIPISLSSGESKSVKVRYRRPKSGALFPGPTFSLPFPFLNRGVYRLQKSAAPTLVRSIQRCASPTDSDEKWWLKAVPLGRFYETYGEVPTTTVRACYTNTDLVIGAEIAAGNPPRPPVKPRDSWLENNTHFMVRMKPNLQKPAHIKVVMDQQGNIYDRQKETGADEAVELSYNKAKGMVTEFPDRWRATVHVPLDSQTPMKNRRLGFTFSLSTAKSHGYWQPLLEHYRPGFGILVLR